MDGYAFERTLLLRSAGAINQVCYLSQVMQEDEPVAKLRQFLHRIETQSERLHTRMLGLLKSRYFVPKPTD